ncbi:MAG: hypothetical protein GX102_07885 [Porphyromonadaceae bacterium]|nr:hypothetical protein [Porphyromonadaceae bacterium]
MGNQHEDLKAIRDMMEKSTKFLSLSGLSGVSAGITAFVGAGFGYYYMSKKTLENTPYETSDLIILSLVTLGVLFISFALAVFFSRRKAHKKNQRLLNKATTYALYNMAVPFLVGGILCTLMLIRGNYEFIASITLIFYGLALVNASKYTYEEVHYLGLTEIFIGILAAVFISKGLLFWTIGFGVCHILYGLFLYKKYDK